jgi:hypothetical protein
MPQPRFVQPNTIVEVTTRTSGARLCLRPCAELTLAILGILGRALALYPVDLHAFVFLSNHWHGLVTPCDGKALSMFLAYVNGKVAVAAQRINGVRGIVWQPRPHIIPVVGDEAELGRLRYILAHGTKERLVADPRQWPGPTAARALCGEETLIGAWTDRKLEWDLRRSGRNVQQFETTVRYPIPLVPLPVWRHLDAASRARAARAIIEDIVREHPGPHLGVEKVLAQSPDDYPRRSKIGSAPAIHTVSNELRVRYGFLRNEFRAAYRAASERHVQRPTRVTWPVDVHLPASTFLSDGRTPSLIAMLT